MSDLMPTFSDPDRDEQHWPSPTPVRVLERPFTPEDVRQAWSDDEDDYERDAA